MGNLCVPHYKSLFPRVALSLNQFIGDFFAEAYMNGISVGFQAFIKRPSHIHTWCYTHVLNFVSGDSIIVCVRAVSIFGLRSEQTSYFNDS